MPGRVFEDLSVGDSAGMTRIVTAAVIEAFADVSTDSNPVHLDAAYAEGTIFKGRIAHGMLSGAYISAVIGMQLPGPGTIYLSQALRFRRPVRLGDAVDVRVTVEALDPKRGEVTLSTVCEVGGKRVVEGEAVVLAPRREAAG
ncbi:MaoC family dehydratase [Phenylobacterium sp.]|jgi:3-hydroxybutyryl-CoA dehydratase|uniref:MaoC family dehydratase n=1 Tax=Phenylobacterium sp. TaxID=1871053 RepID=UPI0025F6B493|nr:MaoC family dehydratase [Phenylobacterium sp.]MCA6285233.1 MaoC family dehydratase [Phenylobacterium sp.]MCA6309096.1 MaoC family dehydratase [Phenylobacterium sp.]MCA6323981.1 MaoC family dehydratase [Phenylobacterium sp.]MCA6338274.1 MaoC family dehydratase [Phenylobacterium sp.]MCA6339146.1 MaoC family dehydratase [Phenylobacterium sp.]